MKHPAPRRRAGRLAALVTAVTLLAAPLAAVPATMAAPTASAATSTTVTITKIGTKTAPYGKKVTVRPRVTAKGQVSVKSRTLTVARHGTYVAKDKAKVALKAGTYSVTTKVTYKTYRLSSAKKKIWSGTKTKTLSQKLVVKQGKKPSRTSPVNKYDCPSWAPVKGNQSGIYHVPGGRYYEVTTPEECFTTASAARQAGYRASKNG